MLGTYYYHEIIRKTIISFGSVFNQIGIRHNDTGQMQVPLSYGPAQKFLARLEQQAELNKSVQITLPRMSFEMNNITYDPTRKAGVTQTFKTSDGTNLKKVYMPVPYNIGFELSIFTKLNNDNTTKVIVIEGSGPGFSAGHNLKEVRSLKKRSKYLKLFNLCSKLMLQIVEGRKPVIAKVHGAAYAAGCQLVASCDLAYSTNDSMFATPGVNIGLFCSTPMVAVSRKVTRKKMMKMLLTGEPIKANYAKEIGLINDYYSKSKLNSEVLKVAKTIASKSNLTIKIGKQAFYKQLEMPLRKAYSYTSKMMTLNMMAMDAKEGISAFLEKRKPKWKNK